MPNHVGATIYRINDTDLATPATFSFPVGSIMVRPAVVATGGPSSTTMNATIQVLAGSAPQPKNTQYHTNSTVAALISTIS